jgi:hypothetical protein
MSLTDKKHTQDEIMIENVQQMQGLYTLAAPPTTAWTRIKHKVSTRDGWIGNYDYRALW